MGRLTIAHLLISLKNPILNTYNFDFGTFYRPTVLRKPSSYLWKNLETIPRASRYALCFHEAAFQFCATQKLSVQSKKEKLYRKSACIAILSFLFPSLLRRVYIGCSRSALFALLLSFYLYRSLDENKDRMIAIAQIASS